MLKQLHWYIDNSIFSFEFGLYIIVRKFTPPKLKFIGHSWYSCLGIRDWQLKNIYIIEFFCITII